MPHKYSMHIRKRELPLGEAIQTQKAKLKRKGEGGVVVQPETSFAIDPEHKKQLSSSCLSFPNMMYHFHHPYCIYKNHVCKSFSILSTKLLQ